MSKRHRSPAYPSLTITEAIKRVKQFYQVERKSNVPVSVAVSHWGYSEKSSGGKMVISALKSYGLMKDTGSGMSRMIRLTDDALNYVFDTVLKPKILREMHENFPDNHVSDATLDFYLKKIGYNPNAISDIINVYRDALRYLEITTQNEENLDVAAHSENNAPEQSNEAVVNEFEKTGNLSHYENNEYTAAKFIKPVSMATELELSPSDTFNVDEGKFILHYPENLSPDSFEDFTDWLLLVHKKISRKVEGSNKPKLMLSD